MQNLAKLRQTNIIGISRVRKGKIAYYAYAPLDTYLACGTRTAGESIVERVEV